MGGKEFGGGDCVSLPGFELWEGMCLANVVGQVEDKPTAMGAFSIVLELM